jgi:two-component system chemotaxis response regulator CheY
VDDEQAIRSLIGMSLASEGFVVYMAVNGRQALEMVNERVYDLVILDLQMPEMDGRTFFRELRAMPCDTPVLLLSAFEVKRAQREIGANDSLDKPFDPEKLTERVKQLVGAAN